MSHSTESTSLSNNLIKYSPLILTSSIFLYAIYQRYLTKPTPPLSGKQGIVGNCRILNDSFRRFVKILSKNNVEIAPSKYFYKNWLMISSTLFEKEELMEAAKENMENDAAIQCVLFFMGFPVSGNSMVDLERIASGNSSYSFDDDQFTENLFNVIDMDNNGYIDRMELGVAVRDLNLFHSAQEIDVEKLFVEMDTDRTGTITLDEFQKWWEDHFDESHFVAEA